MIRPRLAALVAALLAGPAIGLGLPGARPAQAADPGYHQPPVGACYALTAEQARHASATQAPVPCDSAHTTMTVKVKVLTSPVRWDSVYSRVAVACHRALYETLGSTRYAGLTTYDLWWFIPTEEERAQGATWVRCDVGVHDGTSGLGALPADITLGAPPYVPRLTRCIAGADLHDTSCNRTHAWRAKAVFKLDHQARNLDEYRKQGRRCAGLLNVRRYVFSGPSSFEWRAGNHFMVCFKREG